MLTELATLKVTAVAPDTAADVLTLPANRKPRRTCAVAKPDVLPAAVMFLVRDPDAETLAAPVRAAARFVIAVGLAETWADAGTFAARETVCPPPLLSFRAAVLSAPELSSMRQPPRLREGDRQRSSRERHRVRLVDRLADRQRTPEQQVAASGGVIDAEVGHGAPGARRGRERDGAVVAGLATGTARGGGGASALRASPVGQARGHGHASVAVARDFGATAAVARGGSQQADVQGRRGGGGLASEKLVDQLVLEEIGHCRHGLLLTRIANEH